MADYLEKEMGQLMIRLSLIIFLILFSLIGMFVIALILGFGWNEWWGIRVFILIICVTIVFNYLLFGGNDD